MATGFRDEKHLYRWLRSLTGGTRAHWQRLETGSTGRGVPDANLCYYGREFWLELKVLHRAKDWPWGRDLVLKRGYIRSAQLSWITARAWAGGRAALLVALGPRLWAFTPEDWSLDAQGITLRLPPLATAQAAPTLGQPPAQALFALDGLLARIGPGKPPKTA